MMRSLSEASRASVRQVVEHHLDELKAISGFVEAEAGFPVVDGQVLLEPAILVFVAEKKPRDHLLARERAPRQLGGYRVCVMQATPERQVRASPDNFGGLLPTLSREELTYEPKEGNPIDVALEIHGRFLCHAGPDAGWPVLKPFLEGTRKTLSVAMYDFNADHIVKTFIDTVVANNLGATLTWDDGMSPDETAVRQRLRKALGRRLDGWVVRCGGGRRFASAYHEKVAVRDSASTWLSSGNWSWRSQPDIDPIANPADARSMYSRGNREWHVIVDDPALAQIFESYIRYDRDGSEAEQQAGAPNVVLDAEKRAKYPDVFVPATALIGSVELSVPQPVAPAVFPSTTMSVNVQPTLTPDNYLPHILELLRSTRRRLYLQFAYITYSDAQRDEAFTAMLAELAEMTYRPGLDVRIIVGANGAADRVRQLVEAGFNPRAFKVQSNVHNKGIVADGESVLISSTNWSGDGVLRNRDAGLIIRSKEIAEYYEQVFLYDWDNRARTALDDEASVRVALSDEPTPRGMVRMSWADYYG